MPTSTDQREPNVPARGDDDPARLESWKEIAVYLGRDVRTVQRWERREQLPIHRQHHEKQGSVYAFPHEIDAWRAARSLPPQMEEGGTAPRRRHFAAAALVVAGVLTVGGWLSFRQSPTSRGHSYPAVRSIVVLPFENLSGDPAREIFAAGLTEEVTARLARLPALRVVSRTSAMSMQGRKVPVATIARELDVDAVIEGSARHEGERVRISIQLIDARTDTHLWAREFEREAAATWPLQIEVAIAVADAVRGQPAPDEPPRDSAPPAAVHAAREEYLLGRHLLWKFIEADRVRAIAHFERAIRADPEYAAPYAALAHAWWMRGVFGPLSLKEVAAPARAAALAALARDDDNAEAYAALAYVQGMFDWEWRRAEDTARRAVTLEPNSVDARYVHALLLMAMGRLDDATSEIDYAARLDPLSAQVHSTYGRVLYRARRFAAALGRLERALELEPRNAGVYHRLAQVYEELGRYDDALEVLRRGETRGVVPAPVLSYARARILARTGQTQAARRLLAAASLNDPARAMMFAALGDHDAAFASLYRALDGRESWPLFIKSEPVFDRMHDDRRWPDVLRRMNLE